MDHSKRKLASRDPVYDELRFDVFLKLFSFLCLGISFLLWILWGPACLAILVQISYLIVQDLRHPFFGSAGNSPSSRHTGTGSGDITTWEEGRIWETYSEVRLQQFKAEVSKHKVFVNSRFHSCFLFLVEWLVMRCLV